MSAMPAWGRTHSDEMIWDMVAFVRKLPTQSPAQYQQAVKSAPEDHDAIMRIWLCAETLTRRGGLVSRVRLDTWVGRS